MNATLVHVWGSWKSTLQGVVTTVLSACGMVLAVKANPAMDPSVAAFVALIPAKWLLIIGGVSGAGKLWLGAISKDPDKVLAQVPGQAGPQQVPAHAVPDNPAAKVVLPPQ